MKNIKTKNSKIKNYNWFSIIEVLVAIFIFSLWLTSVYAVIVSTLKLNDYNKNYIIASNLAREQVELLKNIRDTNFKTVHKYNQINPEWNYSDSNNFFSTWSYYLIENDYWETASFPIKVEKISDFWEWKSEISWWSFWKMESYRLCLGKKGNYLKSEGAWECPEPSEETYFFKYLKIDEVKYSSASSEESIIIKDALKVKSKVIWYIRWYHETEINTIIADWQRL